MAKFSYIHDKLFTSYMCGIQFEYCSCPGTSSLHILDSLTIYSIESIFNWNLCVTLSLLFTSAFFPLTLSEQPELKCWNWFLVLSLSLSSLLLFLFHSNCELHNRHLVNAAFRRKFVYFSNIFERFFFFFYF